MRREPVFSDRRGDDRPASLWRITSATRGRGLLARSFLAALFGLPLDKSEGAIFAECTGREAPLEGGHREAWLFVGRRAGERSVLALIAVYLACFREESGGGSTVRGVEVFARVNH